MPTLWHCAGHCRPDLRWHTYASTEALFVASWQVPPDDRGPEATVAVGMPQPNHDYALLDEADRPVAPGDPGELVLRSRYLALGEWRQGHVVPGRLLPVGTARAGAVFAAAICCKYRRTACCDCSAALTAR